MLIDTAVETWPSGRRRSPAKGVGPEGSRGFESLRLRHLPFMLDHHRLHDIAYLHGKYEDISFTIAFSLVEVVRLV